MASKAVELSNGIRLAATALGARLFPNAVGVAVYERRGRKYTVPYGLAPGSSDLIGWTSIEVKPEHVGRKLAVFTAVEVKAGSDRVRSNQATFARNVAEAGGVAVIARRIEDARHAIGQAAQGEEVGRVLDGTVPEPR